MRKQTTTALSAKYSSRVQRRKLFSLKKSLVSPAQFISLYGGSFQKNLQVKKNVVYLQCQTVVRKSLQNIQNRIFSKYSTLDLERPKGLHSSCYGLTTPFREFFVVTKFNFNR